jgi:hypothetical protein
MSCLTLPDEKSTGISHVPRVRSNLNGPTIEPKVCGSPSGRALSAFHGSGRTRLDTLIAAGGSGTRGGSACSEILVSIGVEY